MQKVIDQAVRREAMDKPGIATRLALRIPGVKQALEFENPALKARAIQSQLTVAQISRNYAQTTIRTATLPERQRVWSALEGGFGRSVLRGGTSPIKFIGPAEEAGHPITGRFIDIAQHPEWYELSAAQREALRLGQEHLTKGNAAIRNGFAVKIGGFPVREGAMFISNIDIDKPVLQALGGETRAGIVGRSKTRVFESARDRMKSDPTFKPQLNAEKILEQMDESKALLAGTSTFKEALGGKTLSEVIEELHPALVGLRDRLNKQMASLRGRVETAERQHSALKRKGAVAATAAKKAEARAAAIEDKIFDSQRAMPYESGRLQELLSRSSDLRKTQVGAELGAKERFITQERLFNEIESVADELASVRRRYEAANPKPYTLVQEGVYRYFPVEEAQLVRDAMKQATNPVFRFLADFTATVLGGDVSPIVGVQTALGTLFRPLATANQLAKAVASGGFRTYLSAKGLAADIARAPEEWQRFFIAVGRSPASTPEEFAGGFLGKIPGIGPKYRQVVDATYVGVTRQTRAVYDDILRGLLKEGMDIETASLIAGDAATKVFPMVSAARLGQSAARHQIIRGFPTSYSFIRQPAAFMGEATKAYMKMGTGQALTPSEKIAARLMAQLAASTLAASALSAALTAEAEGKDASKAVMDAINPDPRNGKFASLVVGPVRIPIGGPYRGLFRAMFPQRVEGIPVPVPMAGLPGFLTNRLNPAMGTQVDLLRDRDYYNNEIVKGDFSERLWRTLAYEFESVLPLTAGAVVEGVRIGQTGKQIAGAAAGQFIGVSPIPLDVVPARLAATLKEHDLDDTRINQFYQLPRNVQVQFRQDNPELSKLLDKRALEKIENGTDFQKAKAHRTLNRQERLIAEAGLEEKMEAGDITGEQYRQHFDVIQRREADQNFAVNQSFGVYQEDERPDDPLEAAVYDYYKAYEEADTGAGIDFEILEPRLAQLVRGWTPEQVRQVEQETGQKEHQTRTAQELVALRKRLREVSYWDAWKQDRLVQRTPGLAEEYQAYLDAVRSGGDAEERLLAQYGAGAERALKTMKSIDRITGMIKGRMRRENPDIDLGLARFYGSNAVTPEGQAAIGGITAIPNLGPTVAARLAARGVSSVKAVAALSPRSLSRYAGVSERTAREWIEAAKKIVAVKR